MSLGSLTPVKLRVILSLCLVVLCVIGVGLFTVGYGKLKTFAASVQTVADQAQSSQSSVQDLMATKQFLAQNSDSVNRASQLVAESKSYVYQDQIISDLNKYASEAGLSITNITFANPTTTAVGTSQPSTPAPAAGGATAGAAASSAAAAPAGVKSMTASVTLKNPTDYTSMLNFVHLIEQSLFRMQISQIGISASSDSAHPNQVSSDILTIEVYVR